MNPDNLYILPVDDWIQAAVDWSALHFRPAFLAIRWPVEALLHLMAAALQSIPFPLFVVLFALMAWRLSSRGVALFRAASLILIGFMGVWTQAMITIALISTAILICVVISVPTGILCARSDTVWRFVRPVLDAMQTTPTFVYLVPVVMFFGVGTVPGEVAVVTAAAPALVRFTNLGIRLVDKEMIEAGLAFGATERQLLWEVQLPLAMPTILGGLNQTVLTAYFAVAGERLFAPRRHVHAVDGVSLEIRHGEALGIVGESGCGESTLARCLLRLIDVEAGRLEFLGQDITQLDGDELRRVRRHMQPIFQDPYASLNPRRRIADIVAEPLAVNGIPNSEMTARVQEALDLVGLGGAMGSRFPHQLSGGQRQRVGIARAIVLRPALIVADEPIASLDLSIQAQIINLMRDLQQRFNLALVFISHDLRIVRQLCTRIAVMFLGKIVESGPIEDVCTNPRHPYTRALLAAVPELAFDTGSRIRPLLEGDPPSPLAPPSGCRFHTRCNQAREHCAVAEPALSGEEREHRWACHFPLGHETVAPEAAQLTELVR